MGSRVCAGAVTSVADRCIRLSEHHLVQRVFDVYSLARR